MSGLSEELARRKSARQDEAKKREAELEAEHQAEQRWERTSTAFKAMMRRDPPDTAESILRAFAKEIKDRRWDRAIPSLIECYLKQDEGHADGRRYPERRDYHAQLTEWLRLVCSGKAPEGSLQPAIVEYLNDVDPQFGLHDAADTVVSMLREWGPHGGNPASQRTKMKLKDAADEVGMSARQLHRIITHQIKSIAIDAEPLGSGWYSFGSSDLDLLKHHPNRRDRRKK